MTSSHPLPGPCQWFSRLASALDRRSAPRLALLFLGTVLARGRRTVTSWIRAVGLSDQFRPCYTAVAAAGKKAETIAMYLVLTVVKPLLSGVERLTLALDDTPTQRYGPHVQGAGVHHNPTRPCRIALRLRPCLRGPRAPDHPPFVGRDRATAVDGGQPTPQGRRVTHDARSHAAGAARSAPDLRQGHDQPGEAVRSTPRLVLRRVRPLRGKDGQAVQDLPRDLAASRGRDPSGAGGRADGMEGVLLHRSLGLGRRHPHGRGGSILAGDHVPGLQGDRWGGPATGAILLGEHRGVPLRRRASPPAARRF
jgi:hypothetical protein